MWLISAQNSQQAHEPFKIDLSKQFAIYPIPTAGRFYSAGWAITSGKLRNPTKLRTAGSTHILR